MQSFWTSATRLSVVNEIDGRSASLIARSGGRRAAPSCGRTYLSLLAALDS